MASVIINEINELSTIKTAVLWENIINEKTDENSKICMASIDNKDILLFIVNNHILYVNLYVKLVKNYKVNKTLNQCCDFIFKNYPKCKKITTYLLNAEIYGLYLFRKSGFTREVNFKKQYRINNKFYNCHVISKYRI